MFGREQLSCCALSGSKNGSVQNDDDDDDEREEGKDFFFLSNFSRSNFRSGRRQQWCRSGCRFFTPQRQTAATEAADGRSTHRESEWAGLRFSKFGTSYKTRSPASREKQKQPVSSHSPSRELEEMFGIFHGVHTFDCTVGVWCARLARPSPIARLGSRLATGRDFI